MKPAFFPTALRCGVLLALAAFLSSCSDTAALLREVTYPPDFQYVTEQELRSDMDRLAYQLQQLDQALAATEDTTEPSQGRVVAILRQMERIGADLQAGQSGSNHPFLQDHMRDFVSSVSQARLSASQDPPRYYQAGRVAGGCVNCHQVNR